MSCAAGRENSGRTSKPLIFFLFETKWQKLKPYGVNVQGAVGTVWMKHYTAVLCPQSCCLGCDPGALPAPAAPLGALGLFAEGVCLHLGPAPPGTAMETSRCFPKQPPAESPGETWDAVAAKDFPAPGLSDYFLFIVNCVLLALVVGTSAGASYSI